uniref:Uncharacterized protein n=1 Tax=Campylobacter phage vB_CJ12660_3PH123 TaxID=3236702 RepID=A0AB39C5L5_9VIRU
MKRFKRKSQKVVLSCFYKGRDPTLKFLIKILINKTKNKNKLVLIYLVFKNI